MHCRWVAAAFSLVPLSICTSRAAWGFPGDSEGEEPACNAGDLALIPGSERSTLASCLENSMDRGAWRAPVYWVVKSRTRLTAANTALCAARER